MRKQDKKINKMDIEKQYKINNAFNRIEKALTDLEFDELLNDQRIKEIWKLIRDLRIPYKVAPLKLPN